MSMFVFMGLFVSLEIFHSYEDGKGLRILTSWPLNSEGTLTCQCDNPGTRDIHTYCRAFTSGAPVTTCVND